MSGGDELVGQWVRRARHARGWSQEQLGAAADVTSETILKLENDKYGERGPATRTLRGIERAFGVPNGTLRRVAQGDDVPLPTPDDTPEHQLVMLIAERLDQMEQRLSRLEQGPDE